MRSSVFVDCGSFGDSVLFCNLFSPIFIFLGYRSWGFFVYVFHDACTGDFLSNPIECLKSGWILAPNFLSIAAEFCSFLFSSDILLSN